MHSQNIYESFIPHRRETLDFIKKLPNAKVELLSFNSSSLNQLQKRAASLLVVSEMDALASFIYGHNESKKAFVDMLIEWTGSDIFSAIWPKKLIDYFEDDTGHSYREVLSNVNVRQHIDNLGKQKFQSRDEYNIAKRTVIEELCNTVFTNEQCEILRDILWRISDEDGINPDYLKQYEEDLKRKEGRRKYYEYAKPFFNQLDNSEFLKRDTIKQKLTEFLKSQKYEQKILDNTQNLILDNLHHGSYAACVYKFRCDCTHRFDGQNQCFSNVTYNGKLVENINFDLLVNSYNKVIDNLKKKPIEEIKIMYDKYAKSQEGISGLIPVFQAYINDFLKT